MATMTDDDRKERKLQSDKERSKKTATDRQKKFYTAQRRTAEEGAAAGDVKAKATRDKIYSKLGRKPGSDADDADVVNKSILSAAAGPDAIGADLGMAGLKMGVGKLLGSGAMKGAEKAVGDFASKFTKGGKSAEKTTGKVSKMPEAKEPMGKANIKNGLTSGKKAAPKGKSMAVAKSGAAKKAVKAAGNKTQNAANAIERAAPSKGGTRIYRGGELKAESKPNGGLAKGETKSRVPKADKEKYEAGKATAAKNKTESKVEAMKELRKPRKSKGNPKTKVGETIDGQTGKTIKGAPKTSAGARKAKAPKDKADKPAAKKASTSKKKAAEPASKKKSVSRSAKGDSLAKKGGGKSSTSGKTIGKFGKPERESYKREMQEKTRKTMGTKEPAGRTVKRSKEGDRLAKMGYPERNMSEGKTVGKMSKEEYLKKERKKRPGLRG